MSRDEIRVVIDSAMTDLRPLLDLLVAITESHDLEGKHQLVITAEINRAGSCVSVSSVQVTATPT